MLFIVNYLSDVEKSSELVFPQATV